MSAVYFKNRGEHATAAREFLTDLLSERVAVLALVSGASDAAAQAASRVLSRVTHATDPDTLRTSLTRLEEETLALLHECLDPWLGETESRYVDSFALSPLGGGRQHAPYLLSLRVLQRFLTPLYHSWF